MRMSSHSFNLPSTFVKSSPFHHHQTANDRHAQHQPSSPSGGFCGPTSPFLSLSCPQRLCPSRYIRLLSIPPLRPSKPEGPDSIINPAYSLFDIASFCLSVIGTYGIVSSLRLLLPRNVIPHVSTSLNEAMVLLESAEDVNALPNLSEYRATLTIIRNQVVLFRTESHRARGVLQQLRLVFLSGLTYRLYAISAQIEETRLWIELAVDEQRLASIIVV